MSETEREETVSIDYNRYGKYLAIVTSSIILSNPIELIKTRMQVTQELMHKGTIQEPYTHVTKTFTRILQGQGVKGLFKGAHFFLMRTLPSNLGVFTVKELIHKRLTKYMKNPHSNELIKSKLRQNFFAVNSCIGGLAGLMIQILIYPFDYLRVLISNEVKTNADSGIVSKVKEAFRQRGYKGIFNGVAINLFYMTAARAIYFGIFDSYKNTTQNKIQRFLLSYVSLLGALTICFPMDTIRKRVIISPLRYQNSRQCFKHIIKQGDLRKQFYNGWRIVSIQALSFSVLYYLYDIIFTQIFHPNTKKVD